MKNAHASFPVNSLGLELLYNHRLYDYRHGGFLAFSGDVLVSYNRHLKSALMYTPYEILQSMLYYSRHGLFSCEVGPLGPYFKQTEGSAKNVLTRLTSKLSGSEVIRQMTLTPEDVKTICTIYASNKVNKDSLTVLWRYPKVFFRAKFTATYTLFEGERLAYVLFIPLLQACAQ